MSSRADTLRLGLIGAGNMASALVAGWARVDEALTRSITVSDRGSGKARHLSEQTGCQATTDNHELVERSDVIVLCVKPIDVEHVLRQISERVHGDKVVASVAAGVHVATMENLLAEGVPVLRFMPNVPVRVNAGTLVYAAGTSHNAITERTLAAFSLLGHLVKLEERLFDAATALSGSGPAFLGLVIEAFEDAAIVAGLGAATGRELALTTVAGTAQMLTVEELTCLELRRMVASPGGTAAAGLAEMERQSVRGAIIDAVMAATSRARELG